MVCLPFEYHRVLNFPSQKVNRRTGKGSKAATKLIKACSTEEQLSRLILIHLKKMQMRVAVVKFYHGWQTDSGNGATGKATGVKFPSVWKAGGRSRPARWMNG